LNSSFGEGGLGIAVDDDHCEQQMESDEQVKTVAEESQQLRRLRNGVQNARWLLVVQSCLCLVMFVVLDSATRDLVVAPFQRVRSVTTARWQI